MVSQRHLGKAKKAKPNEGTNNARGSQTREKLLDVGLLLFGDHGFTGVSARQLANAAAVPLSAIPYHFQTMQALYRETILYVMEKIRELLEPSAIRAELAAAHIADLPASKRKRAAEKAIQALLDDLLKVVIINPQSEHWSRLLMREMQQPVDNFLDDCQQDVMHRVLMAICQLLMVGQQCDQPTPAMLLRAFALMGQVVIFRHIQLVVLQTMQWKKLGNKEFALLQQAIRVEV